MGASPAEVRTPGTDLWVIGNVVIDLMMKDVVDIPGWGEEVLASGRSQQVGGQGANLARAAVHFGLATILGSVVGDDSAGDEIRAALARDGIGDSAIKVAAGQTALAIAAVRPDGERAFITDLGCTTDYGVDELAEHGGVINDSRAVALVGTSNLPGIELAAVSVLLAEAHRHGAVTVFDPGWGPDLVESAGGFDDILRATDVFMPNRDEAQALTGETELPAMLTALRDRGPGIVIITCGEQGSATLDGETPVMVEALPVRVHNAVGAGDVFAAGVISGILSDGDHVGAMVRGTAAAASYVSRSEQRYEAIGTWQERASEVPLRRL